MDVPKGTFWLCDIVNPPKSRSAEVAPERLGVGDIQELHADAAVVVPHDATTEFAESDLLPIGGRASVPMEAPDSETSKTLQSTALSVGELQR